jgi:Holliday junction resolvase RusA-like endonuclease
MAVIEIFVPGDVRGKGRPRATVRGGHAKLYTDAKTASYENLVALAGKAAMAGQPPIVGPVAMILRAVVAVPRSWSKKRQAAALAGAEKPTGKPDLDNVAKACCDGLNAIAWGDDAQVVTMTLSKVYGLEPGAAITVTSLEGGQ